MKKVLSSSFIILTMCLFLTNTTSAAEWGEGELKLSKRVLSKFITYVKNPNHSKAPHLFAVAKDGMVFRYYTCGAGLNQCRGGDEHIIKECNRYSKKNGSRAKCALFARNRTVKWDNGINPGKGKASKFNSKWSDEEIKAKLRELGFLGTESESFVTKKEKTSTNLGNTVEQLETLTKLYESGALTEEEFKEAKKKILND